MTGSAHDAAAFEHTSAACVILTGSLKGMNLPGLILHILSTLAQFLSTKNLHLMILQMNYLTELLHISRSGQSTV